MLRNNISNTISLSWLSQSDIDFVDESHRLYQTFSASDVAARADMIIELWQPTANGATQEPSSEDIGNRIRLGLQLYDIMHAAEQTYEVAHRINEAAGLLLESVNRHSLRLDTLPSACKTRLCDMALSYIAIPGVMDALAYMIERQGQITAFLQAPATLLEILPADTMIESAVLDIALHLLTDRAGNFCSTATVIFNPQNKTAPFHISSRQKHVQTEALSAKRLAREKLAQMLPGQKLLIPLLSVIYPSTAYSTFVGHFSAAIAIKTGQGYRFCIFDSKNSPEIYDDIKPMITQLIDLKKGEKCHICLFCDAFQYNNDCGIHTYNFFKLCITAPEEFFYNSAPLAKLFREYVAKQHVMNATLYDNTRAASRLLRMRFMLDCIHDGYNDGLLSNLQILTRFHQGDATDKSAFAREHAGRQSFWRSIGVGLLNWVPFTRNTDNNNAAGQ
ncbi:hypothetical protein [Martelella alba]|uniref:Uncharacterized protein n=1 Tax=Martelella alba TaxID=2590451 RepID=A0ABY2SML3_9HYPH|nr:hypothetical protein [Martelella alba]TKI06950.1 hypothetical protein FCN80_08335 [Martelella alba]